jgi:hypothetical protein
LGVVPVLDGTPNSLNKRNETFTPSLFRPHYFPIPHSQTAFSKAFFSLCNHSSIAADTLTLICLISGEPTSNAFKVRIVNIDADVDDLKDAIISKKPSAFEHTDANDLILWRATIPIDKTAEKKRKITVDALESKTELDNTRARLSELFLKSPDVTTRIVVERPKGTHGFL